jgi:hypothetical protein
MTDTFGSFVWNCVWWRNCAVPRNTVRNADYKHRQNHKYSSATDACWFKHRWFIKTTGVGTSESWLPFFWSAEVVQIVWAVPVYVMVMYRSRGTASLILNLGAKVSHYSASWPTVSPLRQSPQLPFARWLWEPHITSGGFRRQKCFTRRETNYDSSDVQTVA